MLVRVTLAAAIAALLPLTAGSAHASCLDDLAATDVSAGYTEESPSHWGQWTEVTGTATVTVHGDDLVSDATVVAGNYARWVPIAAGNTANAAATFANCVAG